MRDDAKRFPIELYEATLGEKTVAELRAATPAPWTDHGEQRDRYLIHGPAVGYWLHYHFGINVFAPEYANAFILDPIGETLTVGDQVYQVPHWCYLSTGVEDGDERPRRPAAILSPEDEEAQLTPADVIAMGLTRFEHIFGFRPTDALDKHFFAVNARRIDSGQRLAIAAGVIGEVDLSHVNMED